MQTYYDILGVPENATDAEIEAAFKSKGREVHPDKVPPGNPYLRKVAAEAFKDLSEAKSILLDHAERQKYDAGLAYMRGSTASSANPAPAPQPQAAPPPKRPPQSTLASTRAEILLLETYKYQIRDYSTRYWGLWLHPFPRRNHRGRQICVARANFRVSGFGSSLLETRYEAWNRP